MPRGLLTPDIDGKHAPDPLFMTMIETQKQRYQCSKSRKQYPEDKNAHSNSASCIQRLAMLESNVRQNKSKQGVMNE